MLRQPDKHSLVEAYNGLGAAIEMSHTRLNEALNRLLERWRVCGSKCAHRKYTSNFVVDACFLQLPAIIHADAFISYAFLQLCTDPLPSANG